MCLQVTVYMCLQVAVYAWLEVTVYTAQVGLVRVVGQVLMSFVLVLEKLKLKKNSHDCFGPDTDMTFCKCLDTPTFKTLNL